MLHQYGENLNRCMDKSKYKNENKAELFTTYNLNFSAVLVACGFKLQQVEKRLDSKALFCFENSSKLQDINNRYWKKELEIEPQLLFDSLKFLKNRLYSDVENNNGI